VPFVGSLDDNDGVDMSKIEWLDGFWADCMLVVARSPVGRMVGCVEGRGMREKQLLRQSDRKKCSR
jgi:hypothetical protein